MMEWEIKQGDVLERLRELPDESVHCVVTSPPYWALRDYGTARWDGGSNECDHLEAQGGSGAASSKQNTSVGSQVLQYKNTCGKCGARRIDNQIGLEQSPDEYVARLVEVFREVKRVLRSDGTLWLNLGDSYAGGGGFSPSAPSSNTSKSGKYGSTGALIAGQIKPANGLKPKDLVGIPWLVAFALRADGWYLRSDIIWAKPNPMPESVTDRPTKSHEYVFLLSKSARYYFDQDAAREPIQAASIERLRHGWNGNKQRDWPGLNHNNFDRYMGTKTEKELEHIADLGRNVRSVWNIPTQPFPEAHFATFPERLVQRCVDAGCPIGGTVLDPFSGSGTTGVVTVRSGRNYIGIELNPEYVAMSERRLESATAQQGLFTPEQLAATQDDEPAQSGLFATVGE